MRITSVVPSKYSYVFNEFRGTFVFETGLREIVIGKSGAL
jgi:hypothetical protein